MKLSSPILPTLAILSISVAISAASILYSPALQAENGFKLHTRSYHTAKSAWQEVKPNETNLGIGYEYNNWQVGEYLNSYNNTSFYLYHKLHITSYLSVAVGGITGYNKTNWEYRGVMPATGVIVEYKNVEINMLPTFYKGKFAPVFGLTLVIPTSH